jgi:hypothetical protein
MVGLLDLEPEQDGHDETEDDDGLGDDGQHQALAEVLLVLGGRADGGGANLALRKAGADARESDCNACSDGQEAGFDCHVWVSFVLGGLTEGKEGS